VPAYCQQIIDQMATPSLRKQAYYQQTILSIFFTLNYLTWSIYLLWCIKTVQCVFLCCSHETRTKVARLSQILELKLCDIFHQTELTDHVV